MDEELRKLERAAAGGAPDDLLRLAAGLERKGDRDGAWLALLPGRADPRVRAALRALPAWTHPHGDAGLTQHLDVAPLTRAPRLVWTAEVEFLSYELVVSAEVLLTFCGGDMTAFDPHTGARRWSRPAPGRTWLADGLVRVGGDQSYAPEDGAPQGDQVPAPPELAAGGVYAAYAMRARPGKRTKQACTRVFQAGSDELLGEAAGQALMLDAQGFAVDVGMGRKRGTLLHGLDGAELWKVAGSPAVLGPAQLLLYEPLPARRSNLFVVERASGVRGADLGPAALVPCAALARDVAVFARDTPELVACRLDGTPLWSFDVSPWFDDLQWVALAPRRVWAMGRRHAEPQAAVILSLVEGD